MSLPGKGVHILVFPFPAQGHMLPLLDLTHQLLLHGLTITILITPKNKPILDPLLSTHPSSSFQTFTLAKLTEKIINYILLLLWLYCLNVDTFFPLNAVDFLDLPRSPSLFREHRPSLFRSQVLLKSAQVEALANGLELSGVKFIWVMKPATAQQVADGYRLIPDGFEERVADQFVNAKLLVDTKELGQKVAESMSGEKAEKVRAKELRSKAMEAVASGGSSSKDIDGLVRELAQLKNV
ncbi:hypothetical protein POM88_015556 [Heracleum sosnowskyi]|uniref:Glucosyltransferase n=1 Tax=Heracleum sosnowskyi TaxID=360622 RepID=A0AAD8MXI8_9APIA|nr:hypothetical protein POM88_015556 [Heracleum sosnowskyi]